MMTGLAWLIDGQCFQAGEWEFRPAADWIGVLLSHYREQAWLGFERYDVNPKAPQKDAHHALEMIGVARYLALVNNSRILTPAAPGQRKMATMTMLRQLGWWLPGKDDAQSAAQHMLAFLLREGELPPRERELLGAISRG